MTITTKQLRQMLRANGFVRESKLKEQELIDWWNSDCSDVARDIISGG